MPGRSKSAKNSIIMKINTLLFCALPICLMMANLGCSSSANNTANTVNSNTNTAANIEPAGTPVSGAAQSQTRTPEALVADLYKQHDANKSPFFQTKDRAL